MDKIQYSNINKVINYTIKKFYEISSSSLFSKIKDTVNPIVDNYINKECINKDYILQKPFIEKIKLVNLSILQKLRQYDIKDSSNIKSVGDIIKDKSPEDFFKTLD